ncbi:glycine/betaine ABC transporter ATP-binding protein [Carnobacterium divergens]|uniref:ABC transporter ATP-binding protein n=1 Tax=Carnobacterium divergens TaxID=2748 RepID=UPI000E7555F8|nr:ABC transporter ATP-binding protein [Carnobacterium divergens]AOA00505.1 glycine/betaine ABC transporter ATP-binding protein [Carnobacterium divergens]
MIRFENVSKSYSPGKPVVSDLTLEINEGEFFVLIGPSGSGKTTTLKMINRLIPLTTGTIRIQDKPISDYTIHELRWNIGYVLQQIALFPNMTIEENITTVPEMKKWSKNKMKERVTELLMSVGLDAESYRHRLPSELSGGEQQRVGVLRAMAADPDIILMDEPFSALDPISKKNLQEDVAKLHQQVKKTIVFVTHDMQEALKLGDRICIMKEGHVEQIGTPDEICQNPKNEFVREFLQSGNVAVTTSQTVQTLMAMNHFSTSPLALEETEALVVTKETSVDDLILALTRFPIVQIIEDSTYLGKITHQDFLAFLSSGIQKGGTD